MAQARCPVCFKDLEINDYILTVFLEAEFFCDKCKKTIRKEVDMEKQIEKKQHPQDPRTDLKDTFIWDEFLKRIYNLNKDLYFAFHFLRCAGSTFELQEDMLKFSFSDELKEDAKDKIRKENLTPNKDLILVTMKKLAKDLNKNKELSECPY